MVRTSWAFYDGQGVPSGTGVPNDIAAAGGFPARRAGGQVGTGVLFQHQSHGLGIQWKEQIEHDESIWQCDDGQHDRSGASICAGIPGPRPA